MSHYNYHRMQEVAKKGHWLRSLGYRCQLSGIPVGKKVKGRYRPYAWHHVSDAAYSKPIRKLKPGKDVILLSKRAHWFVHALGGELILARGNIARQNRRAANLPLSFVWEFPNPAQSVFHLWCKTTPQVRVPLFIASGILALIVAAAINLLLLDFNSELRLATGLGTLEWVEYGWRQLQLLIQWLKTKPMG